MREMRSSIVFLGSLVSRLKKARLFTPGGCEIGLRPIDLHLSALRALGVTIEDEGSALCAEVKEKMQGTTISLSFPSVGATENIMLASVFAEGRTTVLNAAREPEILDLADFLNKCGCKVFVLSEGTIVIEGVKSAHGAEHTIIPDRIVALTLFPYTTLFRSGSLRLHICLPLPAAAETCFLKMLILLISFRSTAFLKLPAAAS